MRISFQNSNNQGRNDIESAIVVLCKSGTLLTWNNTPKIPGDSGVLSRFIYTKNMKVQLKTDDHGLLLVQVIKTEQFMVKGLLHTVRLGSYFDTTDVDDILEKYLVLEDVLADYKHQSFKYFLVAKSCFEHRCNELSDKIVDELYREVDFSLLKPNY